MKKLLIFFLAVNVLAACNNNGMMGGGGWTTQDRNEFMNPCLQGGQTKEICSCVLQKLEKKYSNLNEANAKGGAQAGRDLALECMNGRGNNDNGNGGVLGGMNGNNNNNNNNNNDNNNNNQVEGNWTRQEYNQFVQGCASTAQQAQGFTSEQANEYCECITKKIEQKYSFREANQMTTADFQTEEWQNNIRNCQPRN
jgi:hypothetical protein